MTVLTVFVAALVTALATGLGALPLLFTRTQNRSWLGTGDAVAAGMMTAASASLIYEGAKIGLAQVAAGLVVGGAFMLVSRRLLGREEEDRRFGTLAGADATAAIAIVGAMTAHSFTEGAAVGVSFGEGGKLGLLIALAIAIHNIPEGLAVSLVLVPRGTSVGRAAAWSIVTSLPQPLVAVPAFLFVEEFRSVLPLGLGFAAGAMLWITLTQLVPDALRVSSLRRVSVVGVAAAAGMFALQLLILGP